MSPTHSHPCRDQSHPCCQHGPRTAGRQTRMRAKALRGSGQAAGDPLVACQSCQTRASPPPSGEHRTWPWPWPTPDTTLRIRVTSDSSISTSTSTQHECSAQRPRPWGLLCAPHLCSPPVQPPVRPCVPTAASCLPYLALPHVTPPVLSRQS
jgi:hypothetical protein